MNRVELINYLIKLNGYSNYLEIGTGIGFNTFDKIECHRKIGIDPEANRTNARMRNIYVGYSNDYFESIQSKGLEYDIVLVDGLHEHKQALHDVLNSLIRLKPDGIIIMHDCNPVNEWYQRDNFVPGEIGWNGTAWKAFAQLRCLRNDLEMYCIEDDMGLGIIKRGSQVPHDSKGQNPLEWSYFEKNKKDLMRMISVDEFNKMDWKLRK